jgi:hypothetical protein
VSFERSVVEAGVLGTQSVTSEFEDFELGGHERRIASGVEAVVETSKQGCH